MTLGAADVRRLLAGHGLRPSRALGQNFVADANTVRRIARLAGVGPGARVVEIGAGLGSLTLALAEAGAVVTAVEIDRHLLPVLREVVAGWPSVTVVEADALRVDFGELLGPGPGPEAGVGPEPGREPGWEPGPEPGSGWSLVANLPYNVATPVVVRVLEEAPQVRRLMVMVQREVGERLAAGPGDPAYGAVSVKVAYWAVARVVGRVPPTVFVPRPAVESALVRLDRRPQLAVDPGAVPYDRLFAVVGAGFAQRRKMLRRSLAGVVDAEAYAAAGVRPDARAEELGIQDWGRLAAWGKGVTWGR